MPEFNMYIIHAKNQISNFSPKLFCADFEKNKQINEKQKQEIQKKNTNI
jgi:hypothetical protein